MTTTTTDRIEKRVVLRAPRARVWRALTDSKEFGTWFGVRIDVPFTEGANVRGAITSPGYEHVMLEVWVERIEPEEYFAYRWHPYAIHPDRDYTQESTTLVEFRLEEHRDGTLLTIVESGFDRIPLERRAEAFKMNEAGWAEQARNLERHVSRS